MGQRPAPKDYLRRREVPVTFVEGCHAHTRPREDYQGIAAAQKAAHDDLERLGGPAQYDRYKCQVADNLAETIEQTNDSSAEY